MLLKRALGEWKTDQGPLYAQLARSIEALIRTGRIAPGEALPSERATARALGISRTTVVAAYDALKEQGFVETRQGSGTRACRPQAQFFPPGEPSRTLSTSPRYTRGRIDLSSGGMPALAMVAEELENVVSHDSTALLARSGYAPAGLRRLREEVARHLSRQGLETTTEQILITSGAQQAFALIASLYVRPGNTVALENPTNPPAIDLCRMTRADVVPVPMDENGIRTSELEPRLSARPPRLLYVTPCFSNPTGTCLPEQRRRELAEFAARYRTIVVEDAAHAMGSLEDRPIPPHVSQHDEEGQVLLVGTLSKLFWAGLRIGWIRAREPQVAELLRYKLAADLGSPVLEQVLASRLLPRAKEAQAILRSQMRDRLEMVCTQLDGRVDGWTLNRPAGGPMIWVELPSETESGVRCDAGRFAEFADSAGISIAPGALFSVNREHQCFFGISYLQDPDVLKTGLERLVEAWNRYRDPLSAETGVGF